LAFPLRRCETIGIFDVKSVFLFPWAVVFERLGSFAVAEMWIFNLILGLGLLYEAEESHGQAVVRPSRPRALIDLTTSTACSMRTGERAPEEFRTRTTGATAGGLQGGESVPQSRRRASATPPVILGSCRSVLTGSWTGQETP
jgi:hypothetical protein